MKRETSFKAMLLMLLLFCLSGCTFLIGEPMPTIPNEPRTYNAEYNRVWNSALDTLDEAGYEIAQMDKADGYISTMLYKGDSYKTKVSLRIVRAGNKATVSVKKYTETREVLFINKNTGARTYSSWGNSRSKGHHEKWIKDKIAQKLGLVQ